MKYPLYIIMGAIALTSCSLYKQYDQPASVPDDLYGEAQTAASGIKVAELGWRQVFTDPHLQQLIDSALVRNTDLRSAQLSVEQAQAQLSAAKLGYLPTLAFAPTGSLTHFNEVTTKSYVAPLTAQWQLDVFGSITSRKRQAKAQREQATDYEQAVQSQLIGGVANAYYTLLMFDRQREITLQTIGLWENSVETMQALYEAGYFTSDAVSQLKASLCNLRASVIDIDDNIHRAELALCSLLAQTPHHISRGSMSDFSVPEQLNIGLPVELLHNRPDVRAAERSLEIAYYGTQQARAAFYPNITLSGTLGWTNAEGVINPAKFVAEAVASLVQPIFAGGKLRANLKVSQAQQEQARLAFVQKLIDAGNEVHTALRDCRSAQQKEQYLDERVSLLSDAYDASLELMNSGRNTYLEVLTAQENLLSAQLCQAQNTYEGINALINLYMALGGK